MAIANQISPAVAFPLSELPPPQAAFVRDPEDILQSIVDKYHELTDNEFNPLLESDPQLKQFEAQAYAIWQMELRAATFALNAFLVYADEAEVEHHGVTVQVFRDEGEDLERFRYRVALSWEARSTAGALEKYRYHSYAASPDVLDANFKTPIFSDHSRDGDQVTYTVVDDLGLQFPRPDHVLGVILAADEDGVAEDNGEDQALIDIVYNHLSAEKVRPITDYLLLKTASTINYSVSATLDFYPGVDKQIALDTAQKQLDNYIASRKRLGLNIAVSGLDAALHVAGVQSVHLDNWDEDLIVPWNTVAINVGTTIAEGEVND